MLTSTIVVLALTFAGFVGVGIAGWIISHRLAWPKGEQMIRVSALGVEVIVINAPGADGQRLMLLDACQTATTAIFTAWRAWRPDDVGAETFIKRLGVNFIDEKSMDDIGAALYGQSVAAYLTNVTSSFESVPLAVIRASCANELIQTGQPLMHELLHALLAHFTPEVPGNHDHTAPAWTFVLPAAVSTFHDLYSPATQLQKKV